MGAKENADLVRRGYATFSADDMATLAELFSADIVWHVPGSGELSGAKQGRHAVLAYFGELMSRSGGTVKVTLHDVIGGDEHTLGMYHAHAERKDKALDENDVNIFHVRDGRITEVWEMHEDVSSSAAFWS